LAFTDNDGDYFLIPLAGPPRDGGLSPVTIEEGVLIGVRVYTNST